MSWVVPNLQTGAEAGWYRVEVVEAVFGVAAGHVDEWIGCVRRQCTRKDMAEVSGCLVVDEGSGGVAGVETEAVPGTIGRCAGEEMIDAYSLDPRIREKGELKPGGARAVPEDAVATL
eukprot:scaffold3394_cov90-Skeletonema_marinoi.AAC.4